MSPRRKIPTKAELIRLQKLYKTDEKIGERLGGVPAYLVAYWRRKKNLPKHSQPKFSENEIRSLWERFGDDDRCGLELGISKAAFYNWRRRYNIREKPAFLKLEQLELNLPGMQQRGRAPSLFGKQTVSQKILARAAGLDKVNVGELVVVEPDMVVIHQNGADVIRSFKEIGVEYVWNPAKMVVALGPSEDADPYSAADNQSIRDFAKRQSLPNFYDVREGSYHQVALEKGHLHPGQLVLGTNGYSITYGAVSAFSTGIETTEMATVWASGRIWMKVPETIRVDIVGRRSVGVYARDIVLFAIKQLGPHGNDYKALEYYGQTVSHMSISERITLCNLSVEIGVKAAICPFEAVTRRYLTSRSAIGYHPIIADKDAAYTSIFQINIDKLAPQISGPSDMTRIRPVAEVEGLSLQRIIIGTCSNGRFDDLRVAADILKGKQVNPECQLIVVPGSREVYLEALKKGLIRVFVESGAIVSGPGYDCLPCNRDRLLAPGERCLATTNSAFLRRLNCHEAEVYICSPATAAASALNARITNPPPYVR